MRMFNIDVSIELSVCASSWEEAKDAVVRGLREGRYADDAKIAFAFCQNKAKVGKKEVLKCRSTYCR